MTLAQLKKGEKAWVARVIDQDGDVVSLRLMELGMLEGSEVEVIHEAPYGGDPIAVRIRGSLIALRRAEAARVELQLSVDRSLK
jgi:ferrous iron transport protein A